MSENRICDSCGKIFDDVDTFFTIEVKRRSYTHDDDERFCHIEDRCEKCISSLTLYGFGIIERKERNEQEIKRRVL